MAPSTASGSSIPINGPTTLPLVKFSYCTVATLSSPMQWVHVQGHNDLYAVFDKVRRMDVTEQMTEKHLLKVAYRSDLLEQVELETLSGQVRADNLRAQAQRMSETDRSMMVIVKPSIKAVAVRYQTYERKIRKIQLTFADDSGLACCLTTFHNFALPICDKDETERPTTTQSLPVLNPNSKSFPNPGYFHSDRPMTNHSYCQPPLALDYSNVARPARQIPGSGQPYESLYGPPNWVPSSAQPAQGLTNERSLSQQTSQYTSQNETQLSYQRASLDFDRRPVTNQASGWHPPPMPFLETSVSTQYAHVNPYSDRLSQDPMQPNPTIRSNPFVNSSSRPFSAPETQEERLSHDSYALKDIMPPQRKLPFPDLKPKSPLPPRTASTEIEPSTSQVSSRRSQKAIPARKPRQKKPSTKQSKSQSVIDAAVSKPRPTAKATRAKVQAAKTRKEVLIPSDDPLIADEPRRPALRAATVDKAPVSLEKNRQIGSAFVPPSLSVDDLAPTPDQTAEKKRRLGQAIGSKLHTPTPSPLGPAPRQDPQEDVPTTLPVLVDRESRATQTDVTEGLNLQAPSLAQSVAQVDHLPLPRQPDEQQGPRRFGSPLTETTGNSRPAEPTQQQPAVLVNPHLSPIQSEEILDRFGHWIRKHQDLLVSQATKSDEERDRERLANYAAKPEDERLRILDNQICECLQDENFMKLLKDMEQTWRRTGLLGPEA